MTLGRENAGAHFVPAPEQTSPSTASLEQLIALNDEIAALVRAGVPLASGLDLASGDLPRRLGRISAALAGRLEAGESLPQALAASPGVFPPVYAAVVEAGMASGRLPAALEGLSTSLRRLADLRRMTGSALVYPLIVLLIMYVLFLYSITRLQPQVKAAYDAFDVPENRLNVWLVELGQSAAHWGPWLPLVVAAPLAVAWYWSGRSVARPGGFLARLFRRAWPANRLRECSGLAAFADLLALLVEHAVPLDRALCLAGEASGDAQLAASARQLAEASRRGAEAALGLPASFPPLIGWLLASGRSQPALAEALRHTAEAYRRRAVRIDDWLRLYLPIVLTLAIGATVVVLYALSVFVPWYSLIDQFATTPQ